MSARPQDAIANYKRALRRDPTGWVVWNNQTARWQPLPEKYSNAPEDWARGYAAGFYGCGANQVRIDGPTP